MVFLKILLFILYQVDHNYSMTKPEHQIFTLKVITTSLKSRMTMCKMSPINLFRTFIWKYIITITSGGSRFCDTERGPWEEFREGTPSPKAQAKHSECHWLQAYMWKLVNCPLNYDINNCVYNISVNFDLIHAILLSKVYLVLVSDACLRLDQIPSPYMVSDWIKP